jgi:hypothetical protein
MRLTLLFICLLSVFGGCAASSSHGVVVPKLICYSEKQTSSSQGIAGSVRQSVAVCTDETSSFVVDDMEDDDDKDYLSFKKYKTQVNAVFAFAQLATLSRIHHYSVPAVLGYGNASPKYITYRSFRV